MDKKNSKIAGHHQDLFQLNHDIFLGSKITVAGDWSHEIKDACSLEEKLWQT